MKNLVAIFAASLFGLPALASQPDCLQEAQAKKLSGAAKSAFVKKCVRDRCAAAATAKALAGAARNSFSGKCLAEGLEPFCAEQAATRRLAGAAKRSFMKKCQAGE